MEKERFSPRYFISNFDNAMTKENIDLPSEYDTVDLATLVIWSSSDNERKRLTFTTLSKFEVQKYLESFYSFWALTESRPPPPRLALKIEAKSKRAWRQL